MHAGMADASQRAPFRSKTEKGSSGIAACLNWRSSRLEVAGGEVGEGCVAVVVVAASILPH